MIINRITQLSARLSNLLIGDSRTGKVLKNMAISVILKMISLVLSFIMVPITLSYLSKTGYGLWAALSSILAWFFIFDIGVGNGLRNKYIELKANNKIAEIKYYVSTAYFIFSVLAVLIVIVFLIINHFINWTNLLNAPLDYSHQLKVTALIVFSSLAVAFVARLINTILQADLKTGLSDSLGVIAYSISLLGIIFLTKFSTPSLVNFAILTTGSNLFVTIVTSIILFRSIYKKIAPGIKFIRINLAKDLVVVGVKFFVIQLGSLVLFQTTSIILSNLVGPDSVTDYTITSKYYSIASMAFIMLTQPLWTGYGDAYYKKDFNWINQTFLRLQKMWIILTGGLIVMVLLQKTVYHFWLHDRLTVDYTMSLLFIVFYSLQMWANIYEPFINATSKLKLQLIIILVIIPLFIPFTVYFVKYLKLGPKGILISMIMISGIPAGILSTIQSRKILTNESGIWNK